MYRIASTVSGWESGVSKNNMVKKTVYWSGSDIEKQYNVNLEYFRKYQKISGKWGYEGKKIEYNYNNLGLRCKFDINKDFDFSKYTVFVGCSHVEGTGVDNNHTISTQYEQMFGEPTLNFGVGGAGQESIYHTVCWLLAQKKRPKRIIILWSYSHRQLFVLPTMEDKTRTYIRNTVGNIATVFPQSPPLKSYVKPNYFLEQALLKNSLYINIINSFKETCDIHDFDLFEMSMNPYFDEATQERFNEDKKFMEKTKQAFEKDRELFTKKQMLGSLMYTWWARDVFCTDYNQSPEKPQFGGHFGMEFNRRIAQHIRKSIT